MYWPTKQPILAHPHYPSASGEADPPLLDVRLNGAARKEPPWPSESGQTPGAHPHRRGRENDRSNLASGRYLCQQSCIHSNEMELWCDGTCETRRPLDDGHQGHRILAAAGLLICTFSCSKLLAQLHYFRSSIRNDHTESIHVTFVTKL